MSQVRADRRRNSRDGGVRAAIAPAAVELGKDALPRVRLTVASTEIRIRRPTRDTGPNGRRQLRAGKEAGRRAAGSTADLVVDECHHLSAVSFEAVARAAKAKYVVGLSATVTRKDGHHPIIFMQCGPIRYRVDARRQAAARPFSHQVVIKRTAFHAEVRRPTRWALFRSSMAYWRAMRPAMI